MMMIDPVDRDDNEAQDIGEKSRPHPCQGSWTGIMRRLQLQNHDGNENGHNAVAERFDPVCSHAPECNMGGPTRKGVGLDRCSPKYRGLRVRRDEEEEIKQKVTKVTKFLESRAGP